MRELEGVNELHKSNTDYNPHVVESMKSAARAKNPKAYMDYLGGTKRMARNRRTYGI